MKYYNFETAFITLKNNLVDFLEGCASVLAYEVSKAGACYHFEILTDHNGATEINNFIDTQIITEV